MKFRSASVLFLEVMLLMSLSFEAQAVPWHTMGPRAMGMGGAQVAIAQGPLASYYNPAGLGQLHNTSGLEVSLDGRGEFAGNVVEGAKDLYQINQDCSKLPLGPSCTSANISQALARLGEQGNGAMVDLGGGVNVKLGRAVLFVINETYVGATPVTDTTNVGACIGAGCINNNQSKMVLRGGLFTEGGVGYGYEIDETGLILGGNFKLIAGRVGYDEFKLVANDPGSGALGHFRDNTTTSVQPGVDLGALWDMRETLPSLPWRPRLGIVGRNINNPTFDQPTAAKVAGERNRYSLNGQGRAGFALSPLNFWNLAVDLDLTNNITPIDGYKSRYLSLGTEINLFNSTRFNLPLRAGLQKNVSTGSSGLSYAWGFGLNFAHVMLDVGGMISSKSTQIQSQGKSQSIPNNAALSARFALLFGGEEENARNK